MHNSHSFRNLYSIFTSETSAVEFLIEKNIIKFEKRCECGLIIEINLDRLSYRCYKRNCRKEVSVFKGTFFYKSCIPFNEVLHLCYLWCVGNMPIMAVSRYLGCDRETVTSYFQYCQELLLEDEDLGISKIGGNGVIVEIDETKVGKRKNHRGHHVDGVWVFGGVERTEERKLFLEVVGNRSAETLFEVIIRRILPGSIIYSDMWRGYLHLEEYFDYTHMTVNHSLCFVDPITLVHTNTIEGTWSALKRLVPIRHRTTEFIPLHLYEFIWRRKNENNIWITFLDLMRDVEYLE